MNNAIEIKNLCKNYNSFRLDNVSFTLPEGYIMGFIGANGAGKSTTLRLMMGLAKKDSGKIMINGKNAEEFSDSDREMIGYVPDGNSLPEIMTWPQVDKIMKNIFTTWDSEKFCSMCEKHGFDRNTKISDYSKGMKMRINIAIALCHDSKVLIMDEPTAGLDPLARDNIRDMLEDYVMDGKHSVLLSSHITSDLEKVCDYITFIKKGQIIESLEKDELMDKYVVLHCTEDQLTEISPDAVISAHKHRFGVDALVIKSKLPVDTDYAVDPASLEDIMIFYNKESDAI